MKRNTVIILIIATLFLVVFILQKKSYPSLQDIASSSPIKATTPTPNTSTPHEPTTTPEHVVLPLSNALSRVTKKYFGINISSHNSPVSPERFTGIHTGVDFEVTPDEENAPVPIFAICSGPLLAKQKASGYGGVISQGCTIDGQAYTIIYGHLKLSSIPFSIGDIITSGKQIAVLGKGYSEETDGERKHLHLGIHKGTAVNLHGYVATTEELKNWVDPLIYLR